jgi:hypothetical protein
MYGTVCSKATTHSRYYFPLAPEETTTVSVGVVDPFDHCLPVIFAGREDQLLRNFAQEERANGSNSRNRKKESMHQPQEEHQVPVPKNNAQSPVLTGNTC